MPIDNALTPEGQNALGAAFGYYPQLRRNRTVQDPQAALDMPVQFLRGRLAAFDPLRKTAATAAAAGLAAPDLLAKEQQKPRNQLRPTR